MATKIIMAVLGVLSIAVVFSITKSKKPVITAAKSAFSGVAALMLVNMTSVATGCYIAVNQLTVFTATVFSLPGVIGLVLLDLVFM